MDNVLQFYCIYKRSIQVGTKKSGVLEFSKKNSLHNFSFLKYTTFNVNLP